MAKNQILSFLKTHRKVLFFIAILFGSFLFSGDIAFAEDPNPVIDEDTSDKIIQIINFILAGAASILGIVTSFVTIFIYPGWTNGTMFGLLEYLKEIWILVSNVIYFIFAFILIAIAFMNIIGKGEGTWELKQAMPKFIVGVLIVPFSWFFVQFVLSVSAILTVGVLTLPYDAFRDKELFNQALSNPEIADMEICKHVIISLTGEAPEGASTYTDAEGNTLSEKLFCEDGETVTIKDVLDPTTATGLESSIFGITSVYTYGILKVHELDEISGDNIDDYKDIADLIFKVFFDVLFVIVYLLLMIALFLALFVRGVRLWIYIMLSPAFGLLYFFGKGSDGFGESGKHFNVKEFIALAMVPVYASAALAFGLAFILVASEGIREAAGEGDDMDTLNAGGFSLSIYGAHGGTGDTEKSPLAKMIVEIFGVVILWIAVMAALRSSEATKAIIEPIHKFGSDVGQLAAKAPTYAPIIPTGNGGMSVASLPTVSSTIRSGFESDAQQRGSEFAQSITGETESALQAMNNSIRTTQAQFDNFVENDNFRGAMDVLRQNIDRATSFTDLRNNREFQARLQQMGVALGISGADEWDLSNREQLIGALREIHNHDNTNLGGLFEGEAHLGRLTVDDIEGFLAGTPDPAPTPAPAGDPNFNLNASLVTNVGFSGEGEDIVATPTTTGVEAVRTAIGVDLREGNRANIRTAILRMIPDTDADREHKADALIEALFPDAE